MQPRGKSGRGWKVPWPGTDKPPKLPGDFIIYSAPEPGKNRQQILLEGVKKGKVIPYRFSIPITVRIAEINYGNHVGYQHYFSYFQDARIAYLGQFGFSERHIGGFSMFVSEANCQYKRELLLGDTLLVHCRVSQIKKKSFLMTYRIDREELICAVGTTTNMCFDSVRKKVVQLPESFITAIEGFEGPLTGE